MRGDLLQRLHRLRHPLGELVCVVLVQINAAQLLAQPLMGPELLARWRREYLLRQLLGRALSG